VHCGIHNLKNGNGAASAKTDDAALPRIFSLFCLSSRCRALSFLTFEEYDYAIENGGLFCA
jgi:hypothetical protein